MAQKLVCLTRWQISSRVDWLAVASDLKMQSRLAFRPLTHGRYFLAFFNLFTFFDQQRRVVPVGTQVGVVVFEDNKLAVTNQSTARVDHIPRCRSPKSTLIRPLVGHAHFGEGCAGIEGSGFDSRREVVVGELVDLPVEDDPVSFKTCPG